MWRRCIAQTYKPRKLFDRFASQAELTFANRYQPKRKVTKQMVKFGAGVIARTFWQVGYRADYADLFWEVSKPLLAQKRVEDVIHIGVVAHHLIQFARDCQSDHAEACFYADPNRLPANGSAKPVAPARALLSLRVPATRRDRSDVQEVSA
jgi:hypothetical protein